MRIITIITGVLLVLTSIWCFAHPGATFLTMAFLLGIAMLIHGISLILGFFIVKDKQETAGWILADGIITFILSCIVLSNQLVTDAIIPLFFGMWIMFSGTMRVVASFNMKKLETKGWAWSLALGIISTLAGIYSFFNPLIGNLAIVILIGIFFLIQGINMLTLGVMMPVKK